MVTIDLIIKETSKKLNTDIETVDIICKHVFKFTVDVMKDPDDYHEILFNKLFKFKLKTRFKTDKTKKYTPK